MSERSKLEVSAQQTGSPIAARPLFRNTNALSASCERLAAASSTSFDPKLLFCTAHVFVLRSLSPREDPPCSRSAPSNHSLGPRVHRDRRKTHSDPNDFTLQLVAAAQSLATISVHRQHTQTKTQIDRVLDGDDLLPAAALRSSCTAPRADVFLLSPRETATDTATEGDTQERERERVGKRPKVSTKGQHRMGDHLRLQ